MIKPDSFFEPDMPLLFVNFHERSTVRQRIERTKIVVCRCAVLLRELFRRGK